MLAQFVSVLYSIVDRMYIGHIPEIGEVALAGVGVCGPVVTMIGSVASLVGVGGAPLMSIRMGEGDEAGARRILSNCFVMLCVFAVALMAAVIPLQAADAAVLRRQRRHAALRGRVLSLVHDGHGCLRCWPRA